MPSGQLHSSFELARQEDNFHLNDKLNPTQLTTQTSPDTPGVYTAWFSRQSHNFWSLHWQDLLYHPIFCSPSRSSTKHLGVCVHLFAAAINHCNTLPFISFLFVVCRFVLFAKKKWTSTEQQLGFRAALVHFLAVSQRERLISDEANCKDTWKLLENSTEK